MDFGISRLLCTARLHTQLNLKLTLQHNTASIKMRRTRSQQKLALEEEAQGPTTNHSNVETEFDLDLSDIFDEFDRSMTASKDKGYKHGTKHGSSSEVHMDYLSVELCTPERKHTASPEASTMSPYGKVAAHPKKAAKRTAVKKRKAANNLKMDLYRLQYLHTQLPHKYLRGWATATMRRITKQLNVRLPPYPPQRKSAPLKRS
ncbi:uncharacterized protein UTRI_02569 [Ustilago trichophora]|uniref:Uncharacterized protein n=1 Tax=Ustilago trichophora TaxID=86804 RepID=A0A5C3E6G4_9BASI|nr:uncharacterized protein UTRI_02569 [Ustilago trichophora]